MPWTITEQDNQYCVYTADASGQPVGDALECYANAADAQAYIAALYANVPDVKTVDDNAELAVKTTPRVYALKNIGADRFGGYLVVWGSPQQRDLHGEYFTRKCDFCLEMYGQRPALFHHGLDGTVQIDVIGTIDSLKADDVGLWAEGIYNRRGKYISHVRQMVDDGILNWSSGSLAHLVDVTPDGEIKRWPIVEGSMTPEPAEPRMTNILPLRFAAFKAALAEPAQIELETVIGEELAVRNGTAEVAAKEGDAPLIEIEITTEQEEEETPMDPNMIMAIVQATADLLGVQMTPEQMQQVVDAVTPAAQPAMEAVPAGATPAEVGQALAADANFAKSVKSAIGRILAAANPNAVGDAFKAALTAKPGQSRVGAYAPAAPAVQPTAPQFRVASKFDDLSLEDMSYAATILSAAKSKAPLSEEYYRALADKLEHSKDGVPASAVKFVRGIKANELDHSTQASYGDEFVPDLWASDLWRKVRLDNKIAPLFNMVDMPSNPFELPVESTDPTVYFVPETTAESQLLISGSGAVIPDSKIGSAKVTLSAKKLALRVGFSSELEEDSIIPVVSIYREQAQRALQDSVDYVLLNGDTETGATGNINSDDAAPAATDRFLTFNGLLKAALVTDTTRKLDAGGVAPTLALLRQTRFKMAGAYAADPRNLAYIVGSDVYAKLLGLNEVLTMDKFGNDATVKTGQIAMLDGAPIILSEQLAQAEADGKVNTSSPSATLFGRVACVNTKTFVVGYRRRVALSVEYIPYYDAYQLTATLRIAFINQNTSGISVLYDIAS